MKEQNTDGIKPLAVVEHDWNRRDDFGASHQIERKLLCMGRSILGVSFRFTLVVESTIGRDGFRASRQMDWKFGSKLGREPLRLQKFWKNAVIEPSSLMKRYI